MGKKIGAILRAALDPMYEPIIAGSALGNDGASEATYRFCFFWGWVIERSYPSRGSHVTCLAPLKYFVRATSAAKFTKQK